MRIITIHADFIEFKAEKKALKTAPDVKKDLQRAEECLVVLTAFEKDDEKDVKAVTNKYVEQIKDIANQVKAKTIVLYPYAHLSSRLGNPKDAQLVLENAEKILKKEFMVTSAPFGWYKSFTLKCKGHPLSELSREFGPDIPSMKKEFKDVPFEFNTKKLTKDEQTKLSAAYLTGLAVTKAFEKAKIGEVGLHLDQAFVDIAGAKVGPGNFKQVENQVKKLIKENLKFQKGNQKDLNELQAAILKDVKKEVYKLGELSFVPLFSNPVIATIGEIVAFKITGDGSAYWKGNENNEQLTRLYVVGFNTKEAFDKYLKAREEKEKRSHLRIGKDQELFVISDLVGAGLPLLTPKGTIIRNEIIKFLWDLHKHKGYQQVTIPHIAKEELYKISGHWDKFGDELFKVQGKSDKFVMKPMNCPHHMVLFDSFSYSYRDMPVRYFEATTVYRDEKSGQLTGLSRVRAITQDDGHLFLRVSQIKQEVKSIVEIILEFFSTLGMAKNYWVSLSLKGEEKEKYLGDDKVWNTAEKALEEAAKEANLPFKKIKGEAAFYGPKLDFMFKDALGREWQLATIQLDFNLPERFNLSFINEKGEKERPVVIHRAISGALERCMSILIENYAGAFPTWLSPVQVKVLTVTDRNVKFAKEVYKKMREQDIRVFLDDRSETFNKKVREAQLEQANYMVTIGDKEEKNKTLAIRSRNGKVKFDVNPNEFINGLLEEIKKRK